MSGQALDYTAFDDETAGELASIADDVAQELEYLVDSRASFSPADFISRIRSEARRLLR